MEFKDVSMESSREYLLSGGVKYVITDPRKLHVAESGSHRVEDAAGVLHYIAAGFLAITIQNKSGTQGFAF